MTALGIADLTAGCVLAAGGALILVRRPSHRVGFLFVFAAATWFLGYAGSHLVFLQRGPLVHLHLSYPTGRLRRRSAKAAVTVAYVAAVVEGWINQPWITAVIAASVAVAAIDGHLHTGGPARRADRPALAAALLFAGVLWLSAANLAWHWTADYAVAITYDLTVAAVAVWLVWDLLQGRWTEAALAELVTQLGRDEDTPELLAQLRRAVGDRELTIEYPTRSAPPGPSDSADPAPGGDPGQVRTPVFDGDEVVATLVHGPGLRDDPDLLAGAVSAVRIAVGNERLRESVAERAETLLAARRRLVESGDEQRRHLQAELAAGPDADLRRARDLLRDAAAARPELGPLLDDLNAARDQLRCFADGVRPEALDRGGLAGALGPLARGSIVPVHIVADVPRLAPPIEAAAYFVVSEALANSSKHASATRVTVEACCSADVLTIRVSDDGVGGADPSGSGLLGIADRVAALGGAFQVTSPPGGGAVVAATFPLRR